MSFSVRFLLPLLTQLLADAARADQWGSMVMARCYRLDGPEYRAHLFLRVSLTETGGGQLRAWDGAEQGLLSLGDLRNHPVICDIGGRAVRFETVGYRQPTMRGYCGQCEQTGFRLTVDGEAIWETAPPKVRGDPIFNGTVDVDKEMARVCTERRPEDMGIVLPPAPEVFGDRTSVLVCRTIPY